MWGFVLKRVSSSNKYCSTKVWFEIESILIFACVSVNRLTSILVAWYLFGPGFLCFFCLVSKPGRTEPGALFFLPSIWAMLERAMCSFFLLATLSQTREVPADVVKTSRACFFLPLHWSTLANRIVSFFLFHWLCDYFSAFREHFLRKFLHTKKKSGGGVHLND